MHIQSRSYTLNSVEGMFTITQRHSCTLTLLDLRGVHIHSKAFKHTQLSVNGCSIMFSCVQYSLKSGKPSKAQ